MAHFSAQQERTAACVICPQRYKKCGARCRKKNCSVEYQNNLRKSKKLRKEILVVCHWLYDDTLRYFKIKD